MTVQLNNKDLALREFKLSLKVVAWCLEQFPVLV